MWSILSQRHQHVIKLQNHEFGLQIFGYKFLLSSTPKVPIPGDSITLAHPVENVTDSTHWRIASWLAWPPLPRTKIRFMAGRAPQRLKPKVQKIDERHTILITPREGLIRLISWCPKNGSHPLKTPMTAMSSDETSFFLFFLIQHGHIGKYPNSAGYETSSRMKLHKG